MTVVVFDMDDTLYDERAYVSSGFAAVAADVAASFGLNQMEVFDYMMESLRSDGRGKVFNSVLQHYELLSAKLVKKCVSIYRLHEPHIQLFADAIQCLDRLRNRYPLYLVTDGNKVAQANKVKALGLAQYMKKSYITHRYGVHHAKPSPYVFQQICLLEKREPHEVIYVGDNPYKDFVGIKKEGFQTVRMMRGHFALVVKSPEFEADYQIHSLDEMTEEFIQAVAANRAFRKEGIT